MAIILEILPHRKSLARAGTPRYHFISGLKSDSTPVCYKGVARTHKN
ncbi:hypothetical protein EC07798_2493 [Escherichia coli 07798]|nr:hypothetical protein EC07798_2493 [Escherichia coli 07798]